MKNKIAITLIIMSALLLGSCAPKATATKDEISAAPLQMDGSAPSAPQPSGEYVSKEMSAVAPQVDRIVIKNAWLSIAVLDPVTAMQSISSMAEEMGGVVVSSNLYKTYNSEGVERPVADITVRVPAEKLEDALKRIKALAPDARTDILSENTSGQDVTAEYTDTESRLKNLQAAEAQLVKIMEQATKTEDVMSVFRELTSVREQIELLQGQLKYYKDAARLSAISINLQTKEAIKPITVAGWQPGLEAQKALQALVNGLKMLINLLIWTIIVVAPIVLIIGLPIYFIVRAIRKRRQAVKPQEPKMAVNKK